MKLVIHRECDFADILRRIGEDAERASLTLKGRNPLFQILCVEVDRLIVGNRAEDTPNIELQVDRVDGALEYNAIAQLPAVFLGQCTVNDPPLPVVLPGCELVGRLRNVPINLEKLFRVGGELSEKVLGLIVFVES